MLITKVLICKIVICIVCGYAIYHNIDNEKTEFSNNKHYKLLSIVGIGAIAGIGLL